MYIYVLREFTDIRDEEIDYKANKVYEVTQKRYKEIIKNMEKKNKFLIREATKEEVEEYLKEKGQDGADVQIKEQKLELKDDKGDDKNDQ